MIDARFDKIKLSSSVPELRQAVIDLLERGLKPGEVVKIEDLTTKDRKKEYIIDTLKSYVDTHNDRHHGFTLSFNSNFSAFKIINDPILIKKAAESRFNVVDTSEAIDFLKNLNLPCPYHIDSVNIIRDMDQFKGACIATLEVGMDTMPVMAILHLVDKIKAKCQD